MSAESRRPRNKAEASTACFAQLPLWDQPKERQIARGSLLPETYKSRKPSSEISYLEDKGDWKVYLMFSQGLLSEGLNELSCWPIQQPTESTNKFAYLFRIFGKERGWRKVHFSSDSSQQAREDAASWKATLQEIFETYPPMEAASQVDDIRHSFESVCIASEAKLRILVRRLNTVPYATDLSSELNEALSGCLAAGASKEAVDSVRKLIGAIKYEIPTIEDPRLDTVSDKVEVIWDTNTGLTWLVGTPKLPWPGVDVRVYTFASDQQQTPETYSFAVAHRVVNHSKPHLVQSSESRHLP